MLHVTCYHHMFVRLEYSCPNASKLQSIRQNSSFYILNEFDKLYIWTDFKKLHVTCYHHMSGTHVQTHLSYNRYVKILHLQTCK